MAGAVAAAVTISTGGGTSPSVHSLAAPAGAKTASGGKSTESGSSISSAPIVSQSLRHDTSIPLRDIRPAASPHTGPKLSPDAGDDGKSPGVLPGGASDPVVQTSFGKGQIPSLNVNFEGVGVGQGGSWAPPDPNGAVGPNDYFEIVNDGFAIYNKAGGTVLSARPTNTIWSGFGGHCQSSNNGDATVLFDHFAQRWVVQQFQISSLPYSDCIAVSSTNDPTGSWHRYEFAYNNTDFDDYPKLGVWSDGYYISYNIFANGQSYSGPEVCALDKNAMAQGLTATQQCFKKSSSYFTLLPADIDGSTLPPAGSPELLLSMGPSSLQLWKFHVDWATPANSSLTGPTTISVPAFSQACGGGTCIPQPGTTQKLDSLADRLMYRLAYRNFGDHESLVVAQSVTANSASGVRWYELRGPWTSPTVFQSGTYAPDSTYRWMGSVAQDHVGDMALGFAVSSSGVAPSARYTGRLVGDTLGTMGQGEGTLVNGIGSQIGNLSRWGDYTSVSVDPTDDCTFWYLGEYLTSNGSWNWHTRIGSFKFPSCSGGGGGNPTPVVSSFSPTSGAVGTNVDVLGSGFTGLTGVTFGGVPATTFTFNSDGELHATVPTGAQTGPIGVTATGGTGASSTNFTVSGGGGSAPTVSTFSPTSGAVGTPVAITGTGFTGALTVTFNGVPATFTVNGDTSISTTVPTGATTGPIAVTNGTGTGTSSTNFSVTTTVGKPTISGFSPTSGKRGIPVVISGTNLANATVKLGAFTAQVTANSSTQVTVIVPSAAASFGFYRWSVTTAGGTASSSTYFLVTG